MKCFFRFAAFNMKNILKKIFHYLFKFLFDKAISFDEVN